MVTEVHKIIVDELAGHLGRQLTNKCRRQLQALPASGLVGEDSSLKSLWEEICVIAREGDGGSSYDAASQTISMAIQDFLEPLHAYEKSALWLKSDSGFDWVYDQGEKPIAQMEQAPWNIEEIIDYLTNEVVWSEATNWSNTRIRRHEDGQYEMDDFFC